MPSLPPSAPSSEVSSESESEGEGEGEAAAVAIDVAEIDVAAEIPEDCALCWNVMTRTMWPRIRLMLKRISMVFGVLGGGVLGYMWFCGSLAVLITSANVTPGQCFDFDNLS